MAELFNTPDILPIIFGQTDPKQTEGSMSEGLMNGISSGMDSRADYNKDKAEWEAGGKVGTEPSYTKQFFTGNSGYQPSRTPQGMRYDSNGVQTGKVLDSTVELVAGVSSAVAKAMGVASTF